MLTTKYDRLGKKIDSVFPLLDPDLDLPTAINLHKEASDPKNTFVTSTGDAFMAWIMKEMNDLGRQKYIDTLCQQYPIVMPFVPTQKVLKKLVVKASTLLSEQQTNFGVNPKELKRLLNQNDLNEPIYEPYMTVRVVPRPIKYPSMEDYPSFYKQTNLMHLCEKYKAIDWKQPESSNMTTTD